MRTWKNTRIFVALLLTTLVWGCGMTETNVFQLKPLDGMKDVPVSEDSKKLDEEVIAFFRNQFSIKSSRYYQVSSEIPWIAVSKYVQNQMIDKSVQRTMFDWYEPGIDFIDVYSKGNNGGAYALAMPKGTNPNADKLIGFYVLSAHQAAAE